MKYIRFIICFLAVISFLWFPYNVKAGTGCVFNVDSAGTLTQSLTEWWEMEENSATRTGSYADTVLTDENTVGVTAGIVDDAANFVAANSERLLNNIDATGDRFNITGDYSISLWVNGSLSNKVLISRFPMPGFILGIGGVTANRVDWAIDDNVGNSLTKTNDVNLSANTTTHIIATRTGTTVNFYINNGAAESTDAGSAGTYTTANSDSDFRIGSHTAGFYDGWIDEVGIWSKVLSTAERADLYNGGRGNTCKAGGRHRGIVEDFKFENPVTVKLV